jgi:hypothetical protein
MAKTLSYEEINQLLRAINPETDDRAVDQCIEDCYKNKEKKLNLAKRRSG